MSLCLDVLDPFVVGLGLDIVGAYLVTRGLLASPRSIAYRAASFVQFSGFEAASDAEDGADGEAGMLALMVGFALQAVAYVLTLGGSESGTSSGRAITAVILLFATVTLAWLVSRAYRAWRLRKIAVQIASFDYLNGRPLAAPSGETLMAIGRALGWAEEPNETRAAYASRVFGVDADEDDLVPDGLRKQRS